MTLLFTDEEKEREKMRVEKKDEKRYLPLISSVIITAVISSGHNEGNKTIPSLRSVFSTCFSAERVREKIPAKKSWRERARKVTGGEKVRARQTAKKGKRREKKDKETMRGWCFQPPDGL